MTLNSWSVEREREGEKCEGEEKEGASELVKGNKGVLLLKAVIKGIILLKMKILSLFTHPHGV